MNEEINSWLNSDRDYNQGVALYVIHGPSASLKRVLKVGGFTKKNLATLIYELEKLSRIPAPKTAVAKPRPEIKIQKINQPPADQRSVFVQKIEYNGLRPNTPEVDELVQHVKNLQKVGGSMHAAIEYLLTDADRKVSADTILEIYEEVDEIYSRLRIYDKTGSLPPATVKPGKKQKKQVSQMDVQELMQRQSTLRSLISKAKKREKTGKKLQTRANNIRLRQLYDLELAQIEQRLKK